MRGPSLIGQQVIGVMLNESLVCYPQSDAVQPNLGTIEIDQIVINDLPMSLASITLYDNSAFTFVLHDAPCRPSRTMCKKTIRRD